MVDVKVIALLCLSLEQLRCIIGLGQDTLLVLRHEVPALDLRVGAVSDPLSPPVALRSSSLRSASLRSTDSAGEDVFVFFMLNFPSRPAL